MKNETGTFEELFSGNGSEAISSIMGMVVAQQNIALHLTKLVLENCVEGKISKQEVFEIYEEPVTFSKNKMGLNQKVFEGGQDNKLFR